MATTHDQPLVALDLFAGSGWGVACQRLGIEEHGVEIVPEAVATRDAAGMSTVFRDVWDGLEDRRSPEAERGLELWLDAGGFANDYRTILIASPPCQTFSVAGKGAGRRALDDVFRLIPAAADPSVDLRSAGAGLDDRTALVLTPLAYVARFRPTFVALEQVPTVLPVWEAIGDVLRSEFGYSVAVGVLNAEQYGVPQTRRRAILVARRDGAEASLPTPTHSRYYSRDPQRLDEGVLPWVSMAEALGWASDTLVGRPRVSDGRDEVVVEGVAYRARDLRPASEPAQTVTETACSWKAWAADGYTVRTNNFTAVARDADGGRSKRGSIPYERPITAPAPTLDGSGGGWRIGPALDTERPTSERARRPSPEAVAAWGRIDIPEPTVAGDPRLPRRGYRTGTQRQMDGALRLTTAQAATLQSYPAAFPFQGPQTKRFLQIGNAVPPLLAEHILSTFL
ncbi:MULTISPECIES: DNA cytosine methyltransferase [Bacteria]|uniref:DNA cytosine methyltransferase n=1 Tax=Bacteria TaxID=2 RepID=UPI003C7B84C0